MRSKILYVPEGITLDLSEPDLGHPDGMAILERHYRQGDQAHPQFHRANPAFICLTHAGGTNPGLYLKKIGGEWWAVHYESGACRSHRLPAPMSDEHKRQTEYWARAAEHAGYRVELEHALRTGTRPDALIHGPVKTGIEVQRSAMTAAAAVKRSSKAQQAGVTDVWFTGRDLPPRWAWRVPTVLSRELGIPGEGHSWETTPPRRAVTAAGLRVIQAVRCVVGNFEHCPKGRNFCGRYHPKLSPWRGVKVDDVAAQFPAGAMVTLQYWGVRTPGSRHRDAVFLVSPQDKTLYEQLTGTLASPSLDPHREETPPRSPSGAAECRNEQPLNVRATRPQLTLTRSPDRCICPGCESPARLYPGGWLCNEHKPKPTAQRKLNSTSRA